MCIFSRTLVEVKTEATEQYKELTKGKTTASHDNQPEKTVNVTTNGTQQARSETASTTYVPPRPVHV